MQSNYKRLGDFIKEVKARNTDLKAEKLLGININKFFMPSVANVIGTDMSVYKIVKRNQFACNRMHVGRDYRLPVSMSKTDEAFMVSPAYDVFEIADTDILDPEYLMMWFTRREFDRNAWFYTDADVRGGLHWKAFCDMQLPIPSLAKQKEIVKEYNIIQNRIVLNQQLIKKLEETAQAIYKQWFVDFEFPDENGKPYKSNSGEMVFNEELKMEIPNGWEFIEIQKLIDNNIIYNNQDGNHGEIHPKSSDFIETGIPFIMANDINYGTVDLENCSFISKKQSQKLRIGFSKTGDVLLTHKATMGRIAIVPKIEDYVMLTPQVTYYRVKDEQRITKEFIYCLFNSYEFQTILLGESEQSTRNYIGITNQRLIEIIFPNKESLKAFTDIVKPILNHKEIITKELSGLRKISKLLLSKLATIES